MGLGLEMFGEDVGEDGLRELGLLGEEGTAMVFLCSRKGTSTGGFSALSGGVGRFSSFLGNRKRP